MLTPNPLHLQIQEARRFRWAGTSCRQLLQMLLRFGVTAANQMVCRGRPTSREVSGDGRGIGVVTELAKRPFQSQSEWRREPTLLHFQLPACYWKPNWMFSPWLSNIVFTSSISLEKSFRKGSLAHRRLNINTKKRLEQFQRENLDGCSASWTFNDR